MIQDLPTSSELTALLPYLTKQERAQLDRLIETGDSDDAPCDWHPDADNIPQTTAYQTTAFETLYGGAAGGGKSDLILGLARTQHQRSLILRRTFPDLERSLITRSLEFFGDSKLYNAAKHVWNIGKRRIEFGHMESVGTPTIPKDEANYASAPYDFIGFDQLEQFPRYAYEFMFSRARSAVKRQRVRIVASANPVGEGIGWIMERWGAWLDETHPHPAKSGEIRYYKRNADGHEVETDADDPDAVSRTFIAARLSDNKYLGDEYRRTLSLLPEPLRSALKDGNWKSMLVEDAYQVIPRAWVKLAQARWKPHGMMHDADGKPLRMSALGVDVARGGDDKSVYAPRYGRWFDELVKVPGALTPDGARLVKPIIEILETRGEASRTGREIEYADAAITLPIVKSDVPVNIDVIGVGSSGQDTARVHGINAVPVNFGEGSDRFDKSGKMKFKNKRAECWWLFREALDPTNEDYQDDPPALPPDSEVLADLTAPRWKLVGGQIQIEDKEEIKKRLGRSPDCGDALTLANADIGARFLFGV